MNSGLTVLGLVARRRRSKLMSELLPLIWWISTASVLLPSTRLAIGTAWLKKVVSSPPPDRPGGVGLVVDRTARHVRAHDLGAVEVDDRAVVPLQLEREAGELRDVRRR